MFLSKPQVAWETVVLYPWSEHILYACKENVREFTNWPLFKMHCCVLRTSMNAFWAIFVEEHVYSCQSAAFREPGTELTRPLHSAHTALSRMLCYSRLLVVYSQTGLLPFCLEYEASERHSVWLRENRGFSDIRIWPALVKPGQSAFSLSTEKANLS